MSLIKKKDKRRQNGKNQHLKCIGSFKVQHGDSEHKKKWITNQLRDTRTNQRKSGIVLADFPDLMCADVCMLCGKLIQV